MRHLWLASAVLLLSSFTGCGKVAATDPPSTCVPLDPTATYVWHFEDAPNGSVEESRFAFAPAPLTPAESIGPGAPGCGNGLHRKSGAAPLRLATDEGLASKSFRLSFWFRTAARTTSIFDDVLVENFGDRKGWQAGLDNYGGASVMVYDGTDSSHGIGVVGDLADGAWHSLVIEIVEPQGRFTVDGKTRGWIGTGPWVPSAPSHLTVVIDGDIDELSFKVDL